MTSPSFRKAPAGVDKSILTWDRLDVLDQIADSGGEASFQTLRFYLDLGPSSLHNHLAKLEEADLIRVEKRFVDRKPETRAILTEAGVEALDDVAARMQEFSERNERRREKLAALHRKDRG